MLEAKEEHHHRNPSVPTTREMLEQPNKFYYGERSKGWEDVDISIQFAIEEGLCINLNCGAVNGGNNLTDARKATHGNFCGPCAEEL